MSKRTRGIPALAGFVLALELATLAVYARTSGYGFISLDDPGYVYENPMVKAGLTASGAAWAFTTSSPNWHPLTWLSHMLDCQLFGLDAGAHHLVNLALHMASILVLFLALARMTRQPWRSALVAGIFALHPLHVESVAWIAERKDVLSGFFAALTLLLYARYAEAPTRRRYVPMALAFALGLLAKSMLVTLPLVLLLMDLWPLRRIEWPPAWPALRPLLREKVPLLAMSAACSLLTVLAYRDTGQLATLTTLPISARLGNAAMAYATYLGMTFWPTDLAVLYPFHRHAAGAVLAAVALLAVVTFAARASVRRHPYLLVGWLWWLVMLAPVSGIVQNGRQSVADRYMYLPMVGLSLAVVWGVADLVEDSRLRRGGSAILAILAGAALVVLSAGAYGQVEYWKDSATLYQHTLAVTGENPFIENNLGAVLDGEGKHQEAMQYYREAIASEPGYSRARSNLGVALVRSGRVDEGIAQFTEAVRLEPFDHEARTNLGMILAQAGRLEEAMVQYTEASQIRFGRDPDDQNNLCALGYNLGRFDQALPHCQEALRLRPNDARARFNFGLILAALGEKAGAEAELSRALAIDPNFPGAREALGRLQGSPGKR